MKLLPLFFCTRNNFFGGIMKWLAALLMIIALHIPASRLNGVSMYTDKRKESGALAPFVLSLASPTAQTGLTQNNKLLYLPEQFPYLGHYQNSGTKRAGNTVGDEYNLRTLLGVIENPPAALALVAPPALASSIPAGSTITFNTVLWGPLRVPGESPIGANTNTNNVIFHPVASTWEKAQHFNIPVAMGIFGADGVEPGGSGAIAFNTVTNQSVNKHASDVYADAMSPDNARFKLISGRMVRTFWILGLSPDKKQAVVSFNIIIDHPDAISELVKNKGVVIDIQDHELYNALEQTQTVTQLFATLQTFVASNGNTADHTALDSAIRSIKKIMSFTPFIRIADAIALAQALKEAEAAGQTERAAQLQADIQALSEHAVRNAQSYIPIFFAIMSRR